MNWYEAMKEERDKLRDERDQLRVDLQEALESWEEHASNQMDYLREKHGEEALIAEIRERHGINAGTR